MITKLYSTSLPANPDVTGNDEQVFLQDDYSTFLVNTIAAGNAAAIGGTDLKGNMTYMFAPQVRKNLQGMPTGIVGNSSDVQGEYSLCYIALDAIHFFATIEDKDASAAEIRSSLPLTKSQLTSSKWAQDEDKHIFVYPSIIPFYHGQDIPYENLLSEEGRMSLGQLGVGYDNWCRANEYHRRNDSDIMSIIDSITDEGDISSYISSSSFPKTLDDSGPGVDFPFAHSKHHTLAAREIKSFFVPAVVSQVAPLNATQPALGGPTVIQVRSAADDEKDLSARIGQAKSKLYFIGGTWDFTNGTVTNVDYAILSRSLESIHQKPRTARADLMQGLLQMGYETAKAGPSSSLYSKQATIHIAQKSMSTNLLNGNLQIAKVGDLFSDGSLFDSTAYLPQRDRSKVDRIRALEQHHKNERVMGFSDAKQSAPKTTIEKIGTIESVDDISCLVVNAANTASTCVDVSAMQTAGHPCLMIALTEHFLELMNGDFETWLRLSHGGGDHVHMTLFSYYDTIHLNISKFATSFRNVNIFETGRPASELDLSFLTKAAVIAKHMTEYFLRLFALETPDVSPLTLSLTPAANRPTSPPAEKRNGPIQQQTQPPATNKKPKRRNGLATEPPAIDFTTRGLFFLSNPNQEVPYPATIESCPGFTCQGKTCNKRYNDCRGHIFKPEPNTIRVIEQVDDHFLATGNGWFNKSSFRDFVLKPKYQKLLGNKNGPFSA